MFLPTSEVEEPREDEVLVRIVATGICHTDLIVRDQWYPVPLPIVLGHEGAGIVEAVGERVRWRPHGADLSGLRQVPELPAGKVLSLYGEALPSLSVGLGLMERRL